MQTNALNQTESSPQIPAPVKEYVPETMTYRNLFAKWFLETLDDHEYVVARQIQKKFLEYVSLHRNPDNLELPVSMEVMESFQKYLRHWGADAAVINLLTSAIELEKTAKEADEIEERYEDDPNGWWIPMKDFDLVDLLPKGHTRDQIKTARTLMECFPTWIMECQITGTHMDDVIIRHFLDFAEAHTKNDIHTFNEEFWKRN